MAAVPPVPDVPEIAKKRFPGRARFVPITQDGTTRPGPSRTRIATRAATSGLPSTTSRSSVPATTKVGRRRANDPPPDQGDVTSNGHHGP